MRPAAKNQLPIIRSNPIQINARKYPQLKEAQDQGHFDPESLAYLCSYGEHFYPEEFSLSEKASSMYLKSIPKVIRELNSKPLKNVNSTIQDSLKAKGVFDYLESLAIRNNGLDKRKKSLQNKTIGRILGQSLIPGKLKKLNGIRALILIQYRLSQLKAQGKIRNFYHVDGPLQKELMDPSFVTKRQCNFLDNSGVDLLVEQPDGKFVPLQIKGFSGSNPAVELPLLQEDFEELQDKYSEKQFWYKKSRREDLDPEHPLFDLHLKKSHKCRVMIKRSIPTFKLQLGIKEREADLFSRLDNLILGVLKTKNKLSFDGPLKELTDAQILSEFIDKGYINVLDQEEYDTALLERERLQKQEINRRIQQSKAGEENRKAQQLKALERKQSMEAQGHIPVSHGLLSIEDLPKEIFNITSDYLEAKASAKLILDFIKQRIAFMNNGEVPKEGSSIDKCLQHFFEKADGVGTVSYQDKKKWLQMLTYINRLSKTQRTILKDIESNNPGSRYTIENFIELKKDLVHAYLEDSLPDACIPDKAELEKLYGEINDESSSLNPYKIQIPFLVWAIQRELNLE